MARTTQKQKLFNGRDHSWMQFNRRVLEEAEDPSNPLLERVKFLAITGSNLDEYVEIRQAGLMQRIEDGYREPGYDGLRPDESLAVLTAEIHSFVAAQYRCWNEHLLPELRKQGVRLLEWSELGRRGPRLCPGLLPARGRPAADPHLHRPRPPLSRACSTRLSAWLCCSGASATAPARRCWAWSPCPAPCPASSACPRADGAYRLPAAPGPDRAEPRRHVPRLRGAGPRRLPRHPQLQPLLRRGRSPLAA